MKTEDVTAVSGTFFLQAVLYKFTPEQRWATKWCNRTHIRLSADLRLGIDRFQAARACAAPYIDAYRLLRETVSISETY
jgi:hypothetical protein